MQIPKRIQCIGELIPEGANIADIGADHGLLEQFIAHHLKHYKILAVENKLGPLAALHESVDCLENVFVSHSDGLNQLTSEYDTIVLAGMGGDNIIDILSKNKNKLKHVNRIIVDAHSFIPKVREEIIKYGFNIECEKIVYEKRIYYIVISFIRNGNKENYSKDEIEFGYKIYLDPLYEDYKNHIIKHYKSVSKKLENSKKNKDKYLEMLDYIRRFESYGQN